MLALVGGLVYACPMADNSNPSFMVDLDFCRLYLGENQYTSTTAYSQDEAATVTDDLNAQGWTLYMSQRII